MCPSGDKAAYDRVEPLLKQWAAKDSKGNPCVAYMGKGGCGHRAYSLSVSARSGLTKSIEIKMIHNVRLASC